MSITKAEARHKQHSKGQFYTAPPICDLLLALTLQSGNEKILEPGCGAGAFLCRAADQLHTYFRRSQTQITEQLTGIELDSDAIAEAQTQWTQMQFSTPANIHQTDFLSANMDAFGLFDVVIGNPPYVRQEVLKQSKSINKQDAHAYIQEKYRHYVVQFPEQQSLLSQTSDLYLWFFLQAASLLKPGGILAFITSNSWLNTSSGKSFREFLILQFDIQFLIESACERWFPDAAVNSVIVILKKKETPNLQTQPIQVIRFHQHLTDWLPKNSTGSDYWQRLHTQVQSLSAQYTAAEEPAYSHKSISPNWFKTDQQSSQIDIHWASLMRMPEDLFNLFQQPQILVSLEHLGEVRYPLKTGINRFFYLSQKQARTLKLEPHFLMPVVKSIRPLKRYRISAADCDTFLFSCLESKEALTEQGHLNALNYIHWGEQQFSLPRQKRENIVPWPLVPSVKNNRPWYAIKPLSPPHLLCSRFYDRRFFFPVCDGNLMEDQTFYGLRLHPSYDRTFIAGLLNSTLTWAFLEFTGRTNLGEGVLQFSRGDMAALPVPNPEIYTPAEKNKITDCFRQLLKRDVGSVTDEVMLSDRQALDIAVLQPLLMKAEWQEDTFLFRQRLVDQLLSRINERVLLAKRKK